MILGDHCSTGGKLHELDKQLMRIVNGEAMCPITRQQQRHKHPENKTIVNRPVNDCNTEEDE